MATKSPIKLPTPRSRRPLDTTSPLPRRTPSNSSPSSPNPPEAHIRRDPALLSLSNGGINLATAGQMVSSNKKEPGDKSQAPAANHECNRSWARRMPKTYPQNPNGSLLVSRPPNGHPNSSGLRPCSSSACKISTEHLQGSSRITPSQTYPALFSPIGTGKPSSGPPPRTKKNPPHLQTTAHGRKTNRGQVSRDEIPSGKFKDTR